MWEILQISTGKKVDECFIQQKQHFSRIEDDYIKDKLCEFSEKIDARGICCLIKRALGDEFATLCISIELLFFAFAGRSIKGKIYSVLNLNAHPYQIFITFFASRPLSSRKKFDSLLSKSFLERKKTPLNNEKQWMKKNQFEVFYVFPWQKST